jgi:pyridoxine kinase
MSGGMQPGIIVISSHVAHGAVGNRIMVPVLETMGFAVIAVPSIVLPWHPGMGARYGRPSRGKLAIEDFVAILDDLSGAAFLGGVGGIITGYLGDAAQAAPAAKLVQALKRANPQALYLCDPVIGDTSGLYVPEETAIAIRDQLMPLADIATPNRHELGYLSGNAITDTPMSVKAAAALAPREIVVTSAFAPAGRAGNLLCGNERWLCHHPAVEKAPNGTGDMLAAAFLGARLQGLSAVEALHKASQWTAQSVLNTAETGSDALSFPVAHAGSTSGVDAVLDRLA